MAFLEGDDKVLDFLVTGVTLLVIGCLVGLLALEIQALTDAEISQFSSTGVTEANTNLQGSVSVTKSGDTLTLVSNNIPDHPTGSFPNTDNPNTISAQSYTYMIPNNPSFASTPTCLPEGPIGFTLNGVAFYSAMTGFGTNAGHCEVFDECDAHASPDGAYHYHRTMSCQSNTSISNQFLGVAMDGYALYGPRLSNGTMITNAELDDCHGTTIDGSYRYYLTETYPYMLGCFKGSLIDSTLTQAQASPNCALASDLTDTTDCTADQGQGPCPPGRRCSAPGVSSMKLISLLVICFIIVGLLF
ncbi:uncharacterized protein LOC135493512 [Lineus longissimus]|uniref:uncharacterized protein LOC135493512 n=1 Tax=Lineus longissimus TaxID=88925 RepID=UPI00315CF586